MLSTNQTKTTQHWVIDLVFMTLILGVFYAIWIGSNALFTPDEGRYSEVAREMVASGDFITPRLNGVAFLDKPILYYWLQASAIKLFGIQEWALRFWPAFMGVLGCLVTYLAGSLLFNRRTGIISGLILATCPLYYGAAHYANLDLEVAVLIGNSLLFFIMAAESPQGKRRSSFLITAYVFSALAFLTKGLIGIVFPGMIIFAWILILNRWVILKNMHLIIGLTLFVAITLPWYVLVQKANPEFLHFFFVTQQVTRFLTKAKFNNETAIWFYIPIVLAGIFPWTVFVIQAITQFTKKIWENRKAQSARLFLLLWLLLIFIFFSIPKSKTVGYILPIFPALALIIGSYIDNSWNNLKLGLIAFIIICTGCAIGFFVAPHIAAMHVQTEIIPYLNIAGIILLISAAIACMLFKKQNKVFYCVLFTGMLFLLTLNASSTAINQRSIKPLTLQLKSIAKPDDEIATYYKFYYDLPIYTGRRITVVADWDAPDIAENDNWVRELWYGMPFQDTKEWLINKDIFWNRWKSDKRVFVMTDRNNYAELKANARAPLYEIATYKNTVLLSNHAEI